MISACVDAIREGDPTFQASVWSGAEKAYRMDALLKGDLHPEDFLSLCDSSQRYWRTICLAAHLEVSRCLCEAK